MKKGYVFIADVTMAVIILILGSAIIYFNTDTDETALFYSERLSEDIIGVLFYTDFSDLCEYNPPLCDCPNYPKLEELACSSDLENRDTNILGMISELLEKGADVSNDPDPDDIEAALREIFVENRVIDERRFGWAISYTDLIGPFPLELYNSEQYEADYP